MELRLLNPHSVPSLAALYQMHFLAFGSISRHKRSAGITHEYFSKNRLSGRIAVMTSLMCV